MIQYNCKQKHIFLFRKSSLRGFYKPRHVTKLDVLLFEYLNYKKVTCPGPVSNMSFGQPFGQPMYILTNAYLRPFDQSHGLVSNWDMLLFRKSSLWGATIQDMSLNQTCFCPQPYGMYRVPFKMLCNNRLGEFSLHKMKIAFQGIQQPVCSQNSPTKLVFWSFCAQSTVPPLHSSLIAMISTVFCTFSLTEIHLFLSILRSLLSYTKRWKPFQCGLFEVPGTHSSVQSDTFMRI